MDAQRNEYLCGVKRLVVKIGSSLIASRDHGLNHALLESLAQEMADLKRQGYEIVIVWSGAILA